MFASDEFAAAMTRVEKAAFDGIKNVCENFLGNQKAENYKEIVQQMLDAFDEMKIHISLKIHLLNSHLDDFPANMGDFSDEHGERFHKDVKTIERAYKGKNFGNMLGYHCWTLARYTSPENYKRQAKKSHQVFIIKSFAPRMLTMTDEELQIPPPGPSTSSHQETTPIRATRASTPGQQESTASKKPRT